MADITKEVYKYHETYFRIIYFYFILPRKNGGNDFNRLVAKCPGI